MIHALDIPWGFQHPDVTYWKSKKIHVYKGALLPPELRRFRAPEFSYHHWLQDEENGQNLPPSKPKTIFKPRQHQTEAAKKIFKSFYRGDSGFLIADKTGLGKGLKASTKIPTPNGFTTMGDLKVGDLIYGAGGTPTKVLNKYLSKATKFYRITFSDGTVVDADEDHRWYICNNGKNNNTHSPTLNKINRSLSEFLNNAQSNNLGVTLPEILLYTGNDSFIVDTVSNLNYYGKIGNNYIYHPQDVIEALLNDKNDGKIFNTEELYHLQNKTEISLPTASPVMGKLQSFKLPPYILGLWLGGEDADKVLSLLEEEIATQYIDEAISVLEDAKFERKIPENYLNANIDQRLELLRGILDINGVIHLDENNRFKVTITETSYALSRQFQTLISSLGWVLSEKIISTNGTNSYELSFIPNRQVFKSSDNKELLNSHIDDKNTVGLRTIKSIVKIEKEEEYYCISVNAPDHLYLITESYIPTHNTLSTLAGITAIAKKEGFDYKNKAKLLIVAPKSVLPQWRNTILSYPVSTTVLRPLIINYEQLNKLLIAPSSARVAKKRSTKNRQTATRGKPSVDWDFVVFDESHKLKNYPSSMVSRSAEKVAKLDTKYIKGKTPFVVFSTATPGDTPLNFSVMSGIMAPLLSKAPVAKTITPAKWGEFLNGLNFNLTKNKNGWRWITVPGFDKNSSDPKKRAAYNQQLRRVKALQRSDAQRIGKALLSPSAPFLMRSPTDIAGWPEQQLIPLPVQLSSSQESIYQEAWTRFRNWLNLTPAHKDPKGALVEMLRYRQKSSLLKVDSITEFIVDQVETGNQIFVSLEFLETLEELKSALIKKKIKVGEFSGRNVPEREKERLKFQKGLYDVILVTTTEGISLHQGESLPDGSKATNNPRVTVVADIRQNSLDNVQLLGRAHRDGQNSIAYIPYLERTVDEKIIDSFTNKFANLKTLTGSTVEDAEELERLFRETAARSEQPNRLS